MALLPGDDGPYVFTSKVPVGYDGNCLIDYLASRFAYQDRATWERRILSGDVSVDGAVERNAQRTVARDQAIGYVHGEYREPEVPTHWKVVAMSESWMAISKPSGMPMHSTPRIFRQTLVWQVRKMFGEGWSPVHRLDRETSGLVLFARGPLLTSWLNQAFMRRAVAKQYLALLHGELLEAKEIEGAIGPAGDGEIPIRQAVVSGGKEARTLVRPIGPDPQGRGTWVVASPPPGADAPDSRPLRIDGAPPCRGPTLRRTGRFGLPIEGQGGFGGGLDSVDGGGAAPSACLAASI